MNTKQRQILASTLPCIAKEGWAALAFAQGVKASGIAASEARKLFPDGIADIASAFQEMIGEAMQMKIAAKRNFGAMRVRDKVAFAVRARLEAVEDHRAAVARLLVWSAMPGHIRGAAQDLWRAADSIWIAAGDTSTDYNYYTKRILLVAVMKATLSFWLNDESEGHGETWEFLGRRIEDVMKIGKGIGVARTVGISDILSFARSRFA